MVKNFSTPEMVITLDGQQDNLAEVRSAHCAGLPTWPPGESNRQQYRSVVAHPRGGGTAALKAKGSGSAADLVKETVQADRHTGRSRSRVDGHGRFCGAGMLV